MTSAIRFSAVILAAGASSRMGRDKALLPWPPASPTGTLLSAAIHALKPFAATVIVVASNNADNLAPIIAESGAMLARNPAPERGQFSSMQIGLRAALDHGCEAAMITPVDCPPLSAASLEKLCGAFQQAQARGAWAVAPEHNGRHGHPLLASRDLIEALLTAPLTSNAREVNSAHAAKFEYVSVPDPLLTADLNTPEQYAAAAAKETP
jgi:molybdenum cofactor cytidylyltransferase